MDIDNVNVNDAALGASSNSGNRLFSKIFYVRELTELNPSYMICANCNSYALTARLPRLSLSKGLDLPDVHESLAALNDLEERMVSPRILFIRMKYVHCNIIIIV